MTSSKAKKCFLRPLINMFNMEWDLNSLGIQFGNPEINAVVEATFENRVQENNIIQVVPGNREWINKLRVFGLDKT